MQGYLSLRNLAPRSSRSDLYETDSISVNASFKMEYHWLTKVMSGNRSTVSEKPVARLFLLLSFQAPTTSSRQPITWETCRS